MNRGVIREVWGGGRWGDVKRDDKDWVRKFWEGWECGGEEEFVVGMVRGLNVKGGRGKLICGRLRVEMEVNVGG